ncbi:translation initiation factor eIF2B [Verticillium dahliae VdLs.17]|uniref:Mannose-1-phosphate guanyltransferase n=2 Tax=Verticillium dahliae TaxID=27337 RepID=G2XC39_VERDV|nr:translation initiation factor eIF2B [Verticillium dahliae VdLs.17]EGY16557.1 translation initiation factor eIF2B [Verticillium dahliae VdLs.17]KAF3349409.1 hypothetical protein VdG2_02255 [Verticillium dahliae VDG2]KAF3361041.1 hypothetical protein VdG1_01050 [Verticillium dahliae VDG1]KAH6699152.1 translation initiation factor eIF2B [Verticillium dahliae]
MPHAVSVPSPGLQALILCGPGSSFPTFTSNPDESPKALLPIANRPMVWYALDFCYRTGITNITLVCPASAKGAIEQALNTNPHLTALPLPRPDILAPSDLEQTTGTAEILRLASVREIVKSDFVVLPCDLVCELAGEKLVQAWMVKAASLAEVLGSPSLAGSSRFSGGLGVWYETKTALAVKKEETDFIASTPLPFPATCQQKGSLLPHLSNLVYSMPKDSLKDLTEEKSGLPIRHGLLRRHPRIRMLTTHRDAHLYIFPKWILDFIKENERFENIGEDVIGWWAKAGWQAGLGEKLGLEEILREEDTKDAADSVEERTPSPDHQETDEPTPAVSSRTRRASNAGSIKSGETAADEKSLIVPPVLAYIHPSTETAPLVRRVDTAQLLLNVSLQLAKIPSLEETLGQEVSPFAHAKKVAYPEGVKSRTTITRQDSLVGDNVTVEEKVSIKESVVGAGCQISEGAKLSQCLLMDGVVVGKNCKLTKCILGKRCVIGDGSVLTNCEVQENLLVEARTEDKDNKLMSSEGLEATEEEMHEVLQDMDDEVMAVNEVAVE